MKTNNIYTLDFSKHSSPITIINTEGKCIYEYQMCKFNCETKINDVKLIGLCIKIPIAYFIDIPTIQLEHIKVELLCNVDKPYTYFIEQTEFTKNPSETLLYISKKFGCHTCYINLTDFDFKTNLFYDLRIVKQTPITPKECLYIKQLKILIENSSQHQTVETTITPVANSLQILKSKTQTIQSNEDIEHQIKTINEKDKAIKRMNNEIQLKKEEIKVLERQIIDLNFLKTKNKELEIKVEQLLHENSQYKEELDNFEEFEKLNDELSEDYDKLTEQFESKVQLVEQLQNENAELTENITQLITENTRLKDELIKHDTTIHVSLQNKIDMLERKLNSYKDKLEKIQKRTSVQNTQELEEQNEQLQNENAQLRMQIEQFKQLQKPTIEIPQLLEVTQSIQPLYSNSLYIEQQQQQQQCITFEDIINKIYVINLTRRPDKKDKVITQFEKHELNENNQLTIVNAIDGSTKEERMNYNGYCNGYRIKNGQTPKLKSEEYAYIRTISQIMNTAIYDEHNKIIIADDDVILCNNFRDIVEEIFNLIQIMDIKYKLLYFGASQREWDHILKNFGTMVIKLNDKFSLYKCYHTQGSFMTVYDKSIFKKVIEYNSYSYEPYDCHTMWKLHEEYKDECFVILPNITIADVRNSDMRARREMKPTAEVFKWDLSNFTYC